MAPNHLEILWPWTVAKAERFSVSCLESLTGGDSSFLDELCQAFCSEVEDCLVLVPQEELRSRMRHVSHTLKASAQYVGAFRLSRMAEQMEKAVQEGSWSRVPVLWSSFQEEARAAARAIQGLLHQPKVA
ncbi:MAG: Hpt domain-containing protein [Candidatus Eremiobacteraeota bacterium]|nr:Hpt domain-containing protein [Candidatus Eremiobacteraeota bacterium]